MDLELNTACEKRGRVVRFAEVDMPSANLNVAEAEAVGILHNLVGIASRRSPRQSSRKNNFVCIDGGQASVQLQTWEVPSPGGDVGNA